MKIRKGFTLVELLIVILVIGILTTMFLLSSTQAMSTADASNIVSNLRNLKTAVLAWYMDHPDLIDYTEYAKSKGNGIVKANASDTVGPIQNKMGTNDALGIGKYMGNNTPTLNPKGGNSMGEGEYAVFDCGEDRATWFVGYKLTRLEQKSILPKLKAKAKSAGLHFASPYPQSEGNESTVWMKVMGNWNP